MAQPVEEIQNSTEPKSKVNSQVDDYLKDYMDRKISSQESEPSIEEAETATAEETTEEAGEEEQVEDVPGKSKMSQKQNDGTTKDIPPAPGDDSDNVEEQK